VAERSAAEQVKALVEAAEREARESREAVQRVAARADELSGRVDELAAGVAEAVAALKQEIEALRSASEAAEPAEAPAAEEEEEASASEPSAVPEGARLLALKMALDGRPREETAAYLGENFELADPESLLDEVYARAEARK
jgi:hypothetical protein